MCLDFSLCVLNRLNLSLAQQSERSLNCVAPGWGLSSRARECPFYCKESTILLFKKDLSEKKMCYWKTKFKAEKRSGNLHIWFYSTISHWTMCANIRWYLVSNQIKYSFLFLWNLLNSNSRKNTQVANISRYKKYSRATICTLLKKFKHNFQHLYHFFQNSLIYIFK